MLLTVTASGEDSGTGATGPQVEVTARFMEVPNSEAVFDWLASEGSDFALQETDSKLTDHSAKLPVGASNALVRQITGIVHSADIDAEIQGLFRKAPAGSDLLTQPKVTVVSGEKAAIQVTQEDSEGVAAGVVTDVIPEFDEEQGVFRLTLTATVQGARDGESGAGPQYRVRQMTLDDYEVPAGQTVVIGGFETEVNWGVEGLFVFVTPELVEPQNEADSGP